MPGESFQTTREAVAQASRRQETVERARAAREARAQAAAAAAKVEADQRDANAAEVVQCGARRWLESIRSRTSQRAAWVCPDHPPPAGQQLALAAWLLRFYEPRHDGGRLSQLCRLILAGLEEGAEAERAFCAAALSRPLTRHWVAVLHRLLLACARQLTPVGGALPAAGEGEGKGGEVVSGVLGPPLRLLLALAEPELWPFTRKLSAACGGSPAARALCLMTSATMSAAGGAVTSACGALVASLPLSLDRPLLGAATTVALLAAGIRAGDCGAAATEASATATAASAAAAPPPPPSLECVRSFALGVLSLPALCEPSAALLPPAVLETLRRGDAVWSACSKHGAATACPLAADRIWARGLTPWPLTLGAALSRSLAADLAAAGPARAADAALAIARGPRSETRVHVSHPGLERTRTPL